MSPRPEIDCGAGTTAEVIRALSAALRARALPFTYVADGRVVVIEPVTGSPDTVTAEGNCPLPVAVSAMDGLLMKNILAQGTFTFRWESDGNGKPEKVELSPPAATLSAVLKPRTWPGLPVLNGIIGSPILRHDGTLLTAPGYDEASGLYLANRVDLPQIPAGQAPHASMVAWAREYLFQWVLGDFRWGDADKANFIAMLVTQVIRRLLRGAPVPLLMVTATEAGAGKTLLTTIIGVLFGLARYTWTDDEEELRKKLTTVLIDQSGVICFDNVPKGTVVRSATLSKLLTDRTWADRILGGNALAKLANDRLWCATGNNLKIGGDMRSRTVAVALDPGPHPERRTGFALGDMESWIEEPANQRQLLTAVLTLAADWAAVGCPQADVVPMRQYTAWARLAGGFCQHHGVPGFLANAGAVEEMDDDAVGWSAFYARWAWIHGVRVSVSSSQLCKTQEDDRWEGTFPVGRAGMPMTPMSLGRRLGAEIGTSHGKYTLRSAGGHESARLWWLDYTPS